ncbi:MAG: thiamine diphosphokinase, partial [Treponemataceae bacterium]
SRGALVSLFPVGVGPWAATSIALRWPLDGLEWTRGSIGISNVIQSPECHIEVSAGRFLVVLPLGVLWEC